jgi:hypothetical protein
MSLRVESGQRFEGDKDLTELSRIGGRVNVVVTELHVKADQPLPDNRTIAERSLKLVSSVIGFERFVSLLYEFSYALRNHFPFT